MSQAKPHQPLDKSSTPSKPCNMKVDTFQRNPSVYRFLPKKPSCQCICLDTVSPTTSSRPSYSANSSTVAVESPTPTSPDSLNSGLERTENDDLAPLSLPMSPSLSQPTSPPVGAVDPPSGARGTNLIRRLSRGAQNRLRGRTSSTNIRDQSLGTVRRRSDSRSVNDGSMDVSDYELDSDDEQVSYGLNALKIEGPGAAPRPPVRRLSRRGSDRTVVRATSWTSGDVSPVTKVSRKKGKKLFFFLDEGAAKVCWSHTPSYPRKQVYVDDIKEIREGEEAKCHLEELIGTLEPLARWFTVFYYVPDKSKGRIIKAMHIIAPDEKTRLYWTATLRRLIKTRENLMAGMAGNSEKHWVAHWRREMIKIWGSTAHNEDEEKMDFATVKRLCRSFSINKSDFDLRQQFDSVDIHGLAALRLPQYLEFFRGLTDRKDIRHIFEDYKSSKHATMSFDYFFAFLQRCQGVSHDADRNQWEAIFNKFVARRKTHGPACSDHEEGMTFESFREFLCSSANAPLVGAPTKFTLDQPLNEYFISSSHNTYLLGRQWKGQSSPEQYVEALKKGCRCVEVDCWDGDDGRPRVTHGRTWTSRVLFADCIKAINKWAFFASDYPIIISLEVHCNPEQQRVMADIMKEQFGSKLILKPLHLGSEVLPSPEELKGRILIKVKKPGEPSLTTPQPAMSTVHRRQRSASAPGSLPRFPYDFAMEEDSYFPPVPPLLTPSLRSATYTGSKSPLRSPTNSRATSVSESSSEDSDADSELARAAKTKKPRSSKIAGPLGDMGVYTRGIRFAGWSADETQEYNHIFSFKETTFQERCKVPDAKLALEKHNTQHLMRVYPKATRFDSSNFDPLQFWRRGVQMVATNWQTQDLGTQINDAMFAAGADRTGYVLKPDELRPLDGCGGFRKVSKKLVRFSVDVVSAQYLETPTDLRPDANMNPYVELEMFIAEDKAKGIAHGSGGVDASAQEGKSGIGAPVRKRTRIIEGNGYDPAWHESISMTLATKYPSLVFVRLSVWNSPDCRNLSRSNEALASFTAKLSSLQNGYRHLPLFNARGQPLHSKLFCRIRKREDEDLEPSTIYDMPLETPRSSEDSARTGKDFLRRVFQRTPSERKKSKERESGFFSRTTSMERQ